MWICDGPGKGHHFSNFSQHGLVRDCLWGHFEKSEAKRKTLSGICGFVMVLARLTIPPTFPNMVWQGVVLGTILEKANPQQKLIRNLCEIDGPDKGRHFPNFSQHGLARGCLPEHFGKSEPTAKAYQESL